MKYVKLYEELKFNEKKYHTYDLVNLAIQKYLGTKEENIMIDMIKSGQIDLDLKEQLTNKTALMLTMINRYENVFSELIKSGANLDIKDSNDNTALILSAKGSTGSSSNFYITMMEKLIEAGANWNITQFYGSRNNGQYKDFLDYLKDDELKRHVLKKYNKQYEDYLLIKNSNKFNI